MKVLLFTISFEGGAGGAAYRLHQGLRKFGIPASVLVQSKIDGEDVVFAPQTRLAEIINKLRPRIDSFPLRLYPQREFIREWPSSILM